MLKLKINQVILIPVEITVYADRSFTFITKTPPALKVNSEISKIKKRFSEPNKEKVG